MDTNAYSDIFSPNHSIKVTVKENIKREPASPGLEGEAKKLMNNLNG
jgi:hypothetical protein